MRPLQFSSHSYSQDIEHEMNRTQKNKVRNYGYIRHTCFTETRACTTYTRTRTPSCAHAHARKYTCLRYTLPASLFGRVALQQEHADNNNGINTMLCDPGCPQQKVLLQEALQLLLD